MTGEARQPWPDLPLKRVASVKLGKMVQTEPSHPDDKEAPYLRAAHVQPDGRLVELTEKPMWFRAGELAELDLRSGDVVVVEGGAGYGRSATLDTDLRGWGFQNSINRVRPVVGRADGRFIDYALQHSLRSGQTTLLVSTATIPHFTAEKVAEVRLAVPDLQEQRAIADFLDRETARIDVMVDAQQRLVALLKERRSTAVTGAVTGRGRSAETRHIDSHFIREIPATWSFDALKRHWSVTDCKHLTAEFVDREEGYPLASISELKTSTVNLNQAKHTTKRIFDVLREDGRAPRPGDLILSRNASVGHVARVTAEHPPFAMGQDVCLLRSLRSDRTSSRFVQYALQATPVVAQIELDMVGSTFRRINVDDIRALLLPLPESGEEQETIADILDVYTARIDTMIAKAAESIALMKERRAALISAAVNGRIDVRTGVEHIERELAEART